MIMHSSILSLVATSSLYFTCSSANLINHPTPGIGETVNHLDSNGLLDWKPTAEGGRMTTIPAETVAQGLDELAPGSSQKLDAREEPKTDVGHFTNIGQIADYAAAYACEKDGVWADSARIEDLISTACRSLVFQVPEVPFEMSAWNVYQAPQQPGADGLSITVYFRWYTNTVSAPTLTRDMCREVFEELTSSYCQGEGGHSTDSQGGEIRIGGGDGYLMIGFDPNSL